MTLLFALVLLGLVLIDDDLGCLYLGKNLAFNLSAFNTPRSPLSVLWVSADTAAQTMSWPASA